MASVIAFVAARVSGFHGSVAANLVPVLIAAGFLLLLLLGIAVWTEVIAAGAARIASSVQAQRPGAVVAPCIRDTGAVAAGNRCGVRLPMTVVVAFTAETAEFWGHSRAPQVLGSIRREDVLAVEPSVVPVRFGARNVLAITAISLDGRSPVTISLFPVVAGRFPRSARRETVQLIAERAVRLWTGAAKSS